MTSTETWTTGRLINWTKDFLAKHGAESPRLDAEVLLAHACGCERIELYTAFHEEPEESVRQTFRELVKQRAEGKPVAYLVGHREFYSLSFFVGPEVLIPRPETEFLVISLLDWIKESYAKEEAIHAIDIGTGSGCIPVSSAKHAANLHWLALDLSHEALEVAEKNAAHHEVIDRIHFERSDGLAAVPAEAAYHFIVSNPPYILSKEIPELPRDVRDFEPHLALDGGEQGTDLIERLIPASAERLLPGGGFLMEVSPQIEPHVRELIQNDGRFEILPTVKDLAKHPRIVRAKRNGN
ncbi:Release factor glutamine methyltransferase [Planctomycetales bacterium 10988]|nr:Release factor glutamine methyltransferase [Planctomycetales bacterium 10988]